MKAIITWVGGRARPVGPISGASPPCSPSSPRSTRWPPTATRAPPAARTPGEPPAPGPPPGTCSVFPWLQPLKHRSLREIRGGSPSRRYGTYWTGLTSLTGQAERLVRHRAADFVKIDGADPFFESLDEKIQSLQDLGSANTMSARLTAATVKRYIVDPASRIRLHDLLSRELQHAIQSASPAENPILGNVTKDTWALRLRRHEAATNRLRAAAVTIVQWGSEDQQSLWENALKSLARERSREGGLTGWIQQRRYAALLLCYAVGLTATALEAWTTLLRAWGLRISDAEAGLAAAASTLSPGRVLEDGWMQQLFPEPHGTPTSDHLHAALRDDFHDLLPDDAEYDATFDRFEYYWSLHLLRTDSTPFIGRFAWRSGGEVVRIVDQEVARENEGWAPFAAGLFGSSFKSLAEARAELGRYAAQIRWR